MEHLNPYRLHFVVAVTEQHGKMCGFCEVLREQPCQILVVGVCDVLLDYLDFISTNVCEQDVGFFSDIFFPFVCVGHCRAFSDGCSDGVYAVRGLGACCGFSSPVHSIVGVLVGKEVLANDFHRGVGNAGTVGFRFQFGMECHTKVMQPFGIVLHIDKLPCQIPVVVLGDVITDAGQAERYDFQVPLDFPIYLPANSFIFSVVIDKTVCCIQTGTDAVRKLEQVTDDCKSRLLHSQPSYILMIPSKSFNAITAFSSASNLR